MAAVDVSFRGLWGTRAKSVAAVRVAAAPDRGTPPVERRQFRTMAAKVGWRRMSSDESLHPLGRLPGPSPASARYVRVLLGPGRQMQVPERAVRRWRAASDGELAVSEVVDVDFIEVDARSVDFTRR